MGLSYDDSAFYYFFMTLLAIYMVPMGFYLAKRVANVVLGRNAVSGAKLKVRTAAEQKMVQRAQAKVREDNKLWNKWFVANVVMCTLCAWLFVGLIKAVGETGEVKEWSPYTILGITMEATDREIKKAYRAMSLKYHPDKNPGDTEAAETFMNVVKAHEALTDETAKENYRKYGNPDGPSTMEVGIGLPSFLLDGDNHNSILLVYLVGLVVLVPTLVGLYYRHSKKFGDANVYVKTRAIWSEVTGNKPDLGVKGLPEILGLAQEFVVDMPQTTQKDDDQIRKFCKELTNARKGQVQKNGPMAKPKSTVYCADRHPQDQRVFKFAWMMDTSNDVRAPQLSEPWMRLRANALIHAHIHQMLLRDSSTKKSWITKNNNRHLSKIITETPRFLEFIMSLFTKAPDFRGPRERPGFGQPKNWIKPAQAVVQLSRHMVQALPWNASPLLQIPGMGKAAVAAASKRGRSASGAPGATTSETLNFVRNVLECPVGAFDAMRAVPGLKDANEKRLAEVRNVCESITDIRVECSFTVVGGEVKAQAEAMQADAEAEERKAAAREVAEEDGEEFDEEADYSRPATVTDETFIAEKDFVTCTVTVERENLPLAQHYERRSDDGEDAPLVEWVISAAPDGKVADGLLTTIDAAHSPDLNLRMCVLWYPGTASAKRGTAASKTGASKVPELGAGVAMPVGCTATDDSVEWRFHAFSGSGSAGGGESYQIEHVASGLYLGVRGGSRSDGAAIEIAPLARWSKLNGGRCAQWKVEVRDEEGVGGATVSIVNCASSKPIHRNGVDTPLVYAPRWPMPKEEHLWVLLCIIIGKEQRLVDLGKISSQGRVATKAIKFQAPPSRKEPYNFVVLVQSDSYLGVDKSVSHSINTHPIAELPEYIPHQEDIDLDLEPTITDLLNGGYEDEVYDEESEEEEESDYSEDDDDDDGEELE